MPPLRDNFSVPYGYCACGCGEITKISERNSKSQGYYKGNHQRYINGHMSPRLKEEYTENEEGCWIFNGHTTRNGYGQISERGKVEYAHRYFFEKFREKVPKGFQLDHKCRNRKCINPYHLEVVTPKENVRRGLSTKLNSTQVEEIKQKAYQGETYTDIAKRYPVSKRQICSIVLGESWREDNCAV